MTRPRVCMLGSVRPPFDPRMYHKEVKALEAADYDVTVVCPLDKPEDRVGSVRFIGLPRRPALVGRPATWARILSIVRQNPADVYHIHDADLLPLAWLLAKRTRKPVIYDAYEHYARAVLTDDRLPGPVRPAIARCFGLVETIIAERLAAVIVAAIDPGGEKRFRQARRLVLLRNFPWRAMFDNLPDGPVDPCRLIYLGFVNEGRRSVSILVEMLAMMRHSEAILTLVGPIDTRHTRTKLEALVARNRLEERVRFVGAVPYDQIQRHLTGSAIGLIPLKPVPRVMADIPSKMFEYMACGLPFVVTDLPQPRSFLSQAQAGLLCEPESPAAFAAAVDRLLDDAEERRRLGERGRQAFLEEYNWDTESGRLLDLYVELTKQ